MKDISGYEIEVGDRVAFCVVGNSRLKTGVVLTLTPKRAKILFNDGKTMIHRAEDQISKVSLMKNRKVHFVETSEDNVKEILERLRRISKNSSYGALGKQLIKEEKLCGK